MKIDARLWARRGLALLLSLSMAWGGVPATAYAEALGIEPAAQDVSMTDESSDPQQSATANPSAQSMTDDTDADPADSSVPAEDSQKAPPVSMPAFHGEATVDDATVYVDAEEGAFPAGVHLEASKVTADEQEAAVAAAADALPEGQYVQSSYVLDVRVVDEAGNEVEPTPGAQVDVSFKAAQVADEATDTSVFHVQDNGEIEQLDATVSGDTVAAATDSFSLYVVTFAAGSASYQVQATSFPVRVDCQTIVNAVKNGCEFSNADMQGTGLIYDVAASAIEIPTWYTGAKTVKLTVYDRNGDSEVYVDISLTDDTQDLTNAEISLEAGTYTYNGQEQKPEVASVTLGNDPVPDTDYTVSYANNVSAGNAAQVIVTATADGGYKGSASTNFTIQQKEVTAAGTFTVSDKVYDGTTEANSSLTGASLNGVVSGDDVSYSMAAVAFPDANVGNKTITANIELTGAMKGNYKLSSSTMTTTAEITPAPVKVKANDATMIVDGTEPTYTATVTGLVNGEPESKITYTKSCTHAQAAGTYSIVVTGDATQGNYTVSYENGTLTITSDLAMATVTIPDHVYTGSQIRPADADVVVSIGGYTLSKGTHYDITEYGQNLQVGTGTVTIVGKGTYAGSSKVGTFNITPKSVKVSGIEAIDKYYDGTKDVTLDYSNVNFEGKAENDTLTATATGAFVDANTGVNKTVNLSGLTLGGASAGNYVLSTNSQPNTNATIKPASIAGATVSADDQVYTGSALTPAPTVTLNGETLVAGTDYETPATYASNINVGTATVTVTGKGNYADNANGTFKITKAPVTVEGIKAANKEYDGTTTATLDFSDAKVMAGGTELTGSFTFTATGTFTDAAVADGKTVTIANIAIAGLPTNYELAETTAITQANITRKALTFSGITADDKLYDGTTNATLDTTNMVLDGVIPGETVTLPVTGAFADAAIGTNKVVNITAGALSGADAGHYVLAATGSQTTARASIHALDTPVLHVTGIKAKNKTYDGSAKAELDLTNAKVLKADDTVATGVTIKAASGVFVNETGNADPNAGENKTVIIGGIELESENEYVLDLETSETTTTATISRVALTVAAKDATKRYGDTDPALEATITGGLVEGDTISFDKYRLPGENAGTYDIIVEGQATQGNYTVTYTKGTFTITSRAVTVTGIKANDKTYDGTTAVTFDYSDVTIDGIAPNDDLSVTATGTFADANARDGKNVSIDGITLTGSAASNYTLALTGNQESATASIKKAPVTVSGITAEGKVYDGNTSAELVTDAAIFDGIVSGDTLTVSATGTFDTKNVGESKLVNISDLTLGGTSAANYVLAEAGQQSTTTATITPKAVTVTGLKAENKTYDGSTTATINVSEAVIDGVETGDTVSVVYAAGNFADSAPGTGKGVTLTANSIQLGGADAANYVPDAASYAPNPGLSAAIQTAQYTLTFESYTKTYGDADPEFVGTFNDPTIAEIIGEENYKGVRKDTSEDVGTYTVTAAGADGNNQIIKDGYVVNVNVGSLKINPKEVTVTPIASGKTYGTVNDPELTATIKGVLGSDSISFSLSREAGEEVGTYPITATGDEYQGNYHVTYVNDPEVLFTISANVLKVKGIKAKDKTYDKTTAVELVLNSIELEGKQDGDDVSVTVNGEFIDANAGMGKLVYLYGYELTGADAANYVIDLENSQQSTTANILRKEVTVKAKDASKTYGQPDPAFDIEEIKGLIYGDAIHYELTRQDGENVGEYTIYPAGEEIQPNYKVTFETATFTIGQRRLRVKDGLKAETKVYDGTDAATLDGSAAEFDNLVEGDEVIVTGTGTFSDKNVGEDKDVTITSIVLGGAKGGNYKLANGNQTMAKGTITPLGVTISGLTGNTKTYDGNTDATLDVSGATIATAIDGDDLKVESAAGEFADKNAGEGKDITITNIVLGGVDAGNYVVNDDSQSTAKATIEPKTVAVSGFTAESKTYDGTKTATIKFDDATIADVIDPDEVTIESVTADFEDADKGTNKEITITGVTLGGADAANYTPDWGDPHLKADINLKEVTVVAKDATKVYGDEDPAFGYNAEGLIGTDTIVVSGYEREAGNDVKAEGYVITPKADAEQGNYKVVVNPAGATLGKLTITTKEAKVTPKNGGKTYDNDATNPAEYEAIVEGVVGTDTLIYTITRTPEGQEIGEYTLTASGDEYQGGDEGKNYHVTYGTGTYTIGQIDSIAGAEITIDDETYTGSQIKPENFTVKLGDKELRKDVDYKITYYGENTNAGNDAGYVAIDGIGGYTGYAVGYFNIKPLEITVTPVDASKVYGEADPNLTYKVTDDQGTEVEIVDGNTITVVLTRQQGEDVGTYSINATGGNTQGNYKVTFGTGTFTIGQRRLRVKDGIKAKNKTYDGTTAAELDTTGVVFQNLVEGDDVTVTATGEFEDKNVGTDKKVTISNITLTGSKAANYKLVDDNQTETKANISAATLSVKADTIGAEDKVYDGTTDATIDVTTAEFEGLIEGDDVSVESAEGAFDNKHKREGKTVTISNIVLTGADADNYALDPETTTTTATITPKPVTVSGITAEDKDYDASVEAKLNVADAVIDGLITADEGKVIVVSATGEFKSAKPGTDKLVNIDINSIVLGPAEGADEDVSGDYVATPNPSTISGNINFLEVTVTVDAKEKTYGEDDPELTAKVEPSKYADDIEYNLIRDEGDTVGEYEIKFVNPQAQQKEKYKVTYVTDKLTIKPKAITVTVNDNGKVYGENDPEPLTTIECDELEYDDTIEDLAVEFAREEGEKLGEYQITATEPDQIPDGKKNANYTITFVPGTFTIHEIGDISAATITIDDVTYNGKQQKPEDFKVTLDGQELTKGVDYEIVSYGPNKDAGDDAGTVTIKGIGGYVGEATGTFNIKPLEITVTPDDTGKTYGEIDPALTYTLSKPLFNGDTLVVTLHREQGEDARTYAINASGGETQGNYKVTFETGTFTINKKQVTVDGITANDKVYDGTTDAELVFDDAQIHDLAYTDTLTVTATGTFASKNVYRKSGEVANKRVDITNIKLVGEKAGNYEVVADQSQKTASAKINPAPIKVDGIKAKDKVYDATKDADLNLSEATFQTLVEGDVVTVESAKGEFDSKNVGENKLVSVTDIVLGGVDGGNYYVDPAEGTQATTTATITPKRVLVVEIEAKDKYYDGDTHVDLVVDNAKIQDVYDGDDVTVAAATGQFATPEAGTGKLIDIETITLAGADADNYEPYTDDQHAPSAAIKRVQVIVSVDKNQSKVYGENDPDEYATTVTIADPEDYEAKTADQIKSELDYVAVRATGEDADTYDVTFTNAAGDAKGAAILTEGDYTVIYVPGTFEITSKKITVTADDASKVYGESDPEPLTATVKTLEENDSIDYEVTRDGGENAGTYVIHVTGEEFQGGEKNKNYQIEYVDGTFTITSKEITVTAENKSKTYGEADPELTWKADPALEDGDTLDLKLKRWDNNEDAGHTYPIVFVDAPEYASGHDGDAKNYHITYVNGELTINRRKVTVTADDKAKAYGEEDPELTATVTGTTKGETVTYKLERVAGENPGTYDINVTGEAIQGSYEVKYVKGTFAIGEKLVIVTADDVTKVYGENDPDPLTATVEGLVDDDTITYSVTRETGEDVGTYTITPSGEASQLNGKYAVRYVPGTMTITKKVVTVDGITTNPEGRVYDGTTDVDLVTDDAVVHDLANNDEITVVATGHFVDKHAGDAKDVLIDSIKLSGEKAENYELDTAKSQKMTKGKVTRKLATVKPAENITKVYGESDPEEIRIAKGATVEGVLNGDEIDYLPTRVTREEGEEVGEYDVTFFVKSIQGDYEVTYETGTLTITPRPIKITGIAAKDKEYDATVAAELDLSKIKVENLVTRVPFRDRLEEGRLEVSATAEFEDKNADEGKTVNITGITLSGDIAHNYVVDGESQATATASISKAKVKVDGIKAEDKVYDATTDATLDVTGATFETLFDGDEVSVESATGTFDTKNVVKEGEDNYLPKTVYVSEIVLAGADGGNYEVVETEDESDPTGTQAIASATITPFELLVDKIEVAKALNPNTGEEGHGKVYDRTVKVQLDWSEATIETVFPIDEGKVEISDAQGAFKDPDAGPGKIVDIKEITLSGEEADNYVATPKGDRHCYGDIWRKPVTVTANDASKIYGETDPELSATLDPAPFEGDTIDYTIIREPGEDAGEYVIKFDNPQNQQDNYQVTFVNGTFTINSRPITVTANSLSKIYGEADPKLAATVTSRMNPALVNDDTVEYALKRDSGEDYGTYNITFVAPKTLQGGKNNKNYKITFVDGKFKVNSREITITVNDASKLYGEDDPKFTVSYKLDSKNATGKPVVDGDKIAYTIPYARDRYEADGDIKYTIPIQGAENQAGHAGGAGHTQTHNYNYKINYKTGTLTVKRRQVTVTAENVSKIYGDKDPVFTAKVTGTTKGETVTYTFTRVPGTKVGTYKITPKGDPVQGNYIVTYKTGTLTIKPRPVTVTPTNLSKVYGSKDPKLTAKVVGLVGSDSVKYTISRAKGENVGKYAITATGTAAQGNYKVTFKVGTFTILPKKVKVSAKNMSKVYGTKDPVLTATTTGLVGKDTVKFNLVRQTGEDAGKYAIIPSGKTTQGNYQLEFTGGTFTITRRKVTVTPVNASKYYKKKDPTLKAKVTGTTKGETVTYTLKRAKGEKVGTYKITASGKALQGNYEVTYKTGKFTISDAPKLTPEYSAHVMTFGWSPATYDGDFAGTTGQKRRMEAVTLKVPDSPYSGGITYRANVQTKGWGKWAKNGALAGTWGKYLQAEAFQIKLYGELAKHYDVYYRTHVMTLGWMAWAKNGQTAGTIGQNRRCEAIQVIILRKGSPAPSPDYKGVAQMYNKPSA